ncbi:hypothetical protein GS426_21395 [Rhodococcus hoagii]|nr:hypothetical protein [Prescottella equi]
MTLDRGEAPCSVNSIVSLTEQAYFDTPPCHRISTAPGLACSSAVTPAVAAAADPATGTTTSTRRTSSPERPGLNNPVVYPRGTVALANAASEHTAASSSWSSRTRCCSRSTPWSARSPRRAWRRSTRLPLRASRVHVPGRRHTDRHGHHRDRQGRLTRPDS